MRTIQHETVISAPAAEVWRVLSDTERYPQWNPFITEFHGQWTAGARLRVRISPPGGTALTFRPVVQAVEPGRRLEWLGRTGVPGVFDGRHSFTVEPLPDGRTRFRQAETFTGVAVPLLARLLKRTEAGFREMNAALAARVETKVAG